MTESSQSNLEASSFPTDWHFIDVIMGVECRQVTLDTYQLRTSSESVTVDSTGFKAYRTSQEAFEQWMNNNNIQVLVREDL